MLLHYKQQEKVVLGRRYVTRVSGISVMHKTCQFSEEEKSKLKVAEVKETNIVLLSDSNKKKCRNM